MHKSTISFGLIIVFLFAAIALPFVSSLSLSFENARIELSTSIPTKQKAQLPLAEKESEEKESGETEGGEESLSKKESHFSSAHLLASQQEIIFSSSLFHIGLRYSNAISSSGLPLYLSHRTLLI